MTNKLDRTQVFHALMRKDLSSFTQRSFASLVPGATYLHNWHVDALTAHLERVFSGEIKRLIITMPPRSLKSIAASVAFPAWLLGKDPTRQVVAVSYADGLSDKLAMDSMKVMNSSWYRKAFPMTRIAKDRTKRADFETSRGGGRFSTTIGGTLTGRGGDFIIIDDPHKPEEATSEVKRSSVLDWYKSTLLSRLNDPVNSAIVVIQQRVHEVDLAGMLLEQGGWVHLDLPAIAEEANVVDLGWRGSSIRCRGHLLHPERLPKSLLEQRREELGSYVFAAQYQQRPAPLGGGLIKWEWFKTYTNAPMKKPEMRLVQSWDTASKATEAHDWSVCSTWLVWKRSAWLLDIYRDRIEFPRLRHQVRHMAARWQVGLILIEDAGSGTQLIQDLKSETDLSIRGVLPKDDKATRLLSVSHLIESGRVRVPIDAPWLAEFQREVCLFPNGKHDDQVDSLSQFLRWFASPVSQPRVRAL